MRTNGEYKKIYMYEEYRRSQQFGLCVRKESEQKKAYPAEIRSVLSMWQTNNQQRHSLNGKILCEKKLAKN